MKIILNGLVFILAAISGCSSVNDNKTEYIEGQSSVLKQTVISKSSSSVTFKVVASKGSSCGDYSRSDIIIHDSIASVKIFYKRPKDAVCLEVVSSYEADIVITNLPTRSNYLFKFWVNDTTTRDTTVIL